MVLSTVDSLLISICEGETRDWLTKTWPVIHEAAGEKRNAAA
jgi:hypothetical protein